jgi:hypothetical protein
MNIADRMSPPQSLRRRTRRGQGAPARGFIMGYIVMALLMFGILTAALGRLRDTQSTALWVDRAQATLRANIQTIRTRMLVCAANMHGDARPVCSDRLNRPGLCVGTSGGGSPTTPDQPFVDAMPASGSARDGIELGGLQCGGTTVSVMPASMSITEGMFDGTGGVFLPTPPQGFTPWRYVNELKATVRGDDIFVRTSTTDANAVAAANRLVRSSDSREVEVTTVDGTTTLTYYLRRGG